MQKHFGHRAALMRRSLVVAGLLGAICALPLVPSSAAPAQESAPALPAATQAARPNILFILVDDMGFGDLSLMTRLLGQLDRWIATLPR